MIDVKHCSGCYNDFYNDHNEIGVKACWNRKDAILEPLVLIHVDQTPPYRNLKPKPMPRCYKAQRFVTVRPDQIDSQGYWRRA